MKKIKTIHGETIFVDDEDYEKAKQYRWVIKRDRKYNRGQIYTYTKKVRGTSYKKLILGLDSKMTLFKNNNPLDLRKKNIMVFNSKSEFISVMGKLYRKKNPEFNIKISKSAQGKGGKSSKINCAYIGVRCEDPNIPHPWVSRIIFNKKIYFLGRFIKEEYAAYAYDKKALELYGQDALRNFPELTLEEITNKLEEIKADDAVMFFDHYSKLRQGMLFEDIEKTSKYIGVCIKRRNDLWRATINYHNVQYSLGNYITEEEAAQAYDKKAIEIYGKNAKLNFPELIKYYMKEIKGDFQEEKDSYFYDDISRNIQGNKKNVEKTSKYVGVSFRKNNKKWIAKISYQRKLYFLGAYYTEEEAAQAYNKKALELYGSNAKLNKLDLTLKQIEEKRKKLEEIRTKNNIISSENLSKRRQGRCSQSDSKTSRFVGIRPSVGGSGRWFAKIIFRRKEYFLGSFSNEEEAAKAYDKKALELYGPDAKLNFPIKKSSRKK